MFCFLFFVFVFKIHGKSIDDETKSPKSQSPLSVPNLPTGKINVNTVDCVNVSDYPIR